jgi:phospholipase C
MSQVSPATSANSLPMPGQSGIQHVIVVMMENRSFDHFFGWFPNAEVNRSESYPLSKHGVISNCAFKRFVVSCFHETTSNH